MSCCHNNSEGWGCDCFEAEQSNIIDKLEMECCILNEKLRILEDEVDNHEELYRAEGIK